MPSSEDDPGEVYVNRLLDDIEAATIEYVDKNWGREVVINAEHFIIKLIEVSENHRTSLQRHNVKKEVIAVIDGRGGVENQSCGCQTYPGHITRVRPGEVHRTIGPVRLIEVTTPENNDVERLEDDYGRA